jgi:hypothetical protein
MQGEGLRTVLSFVLGDDTKSYVMDDEVRENVMY